MPGFLSPWKGVPLLLIPEYSGINEGQRVPDRSKTAHRKPLVKCFLTKYIFLIFLTLCDAMSRSTSGLTVHHQLPESTQTHVRWVGDAIQPSYSLSSPSPPALNPCQHQGPFRWVSSLLQVAKYWSCSFSISPSNEHPGLISFGMDWLDLLAVQGTLKVLL